MFAAGALICGAGLGLLTVASLPVVSVALLSTGFGIGWVFVAYSTALQQRTPPELQGRAYAAAELLAGVPQTIGIATGAALVAVVDYRVLYAVMAAATLTVGSWMLHHTARRTGDPNTATPGPPPPVGQRRPRLHSLPARHSPGQEVERVDPRQVAPLRRARDLLDREYARPVDVPMMARAALMSVAHFSRSFREAFGETPYGYLQTRRVERAMALLRRGDRSVTEVCLEVGFTSLGSFGTTFTRLVGMPPGAYRASDHSALAPIPPCVAKAWTRPSRNGEAPEST